MVPPTAVGRTQSETTPSIAVIEAIATREGVDPVDLERPLHDVIDPEALDRLVRGEAGRSDGAACEISFTYYGYTVTVASGGTVRVDGDGAVA